VNQAGLAVFPSWMPSSSQAIPPRPLVSPGPPPVYSLVHDLSGIEAAAAADRRGDVRKREKAREDAVIKQFFLHVEPETARQHPVGRKVAVTDFAFGVRLQYVADAG